MIPDIFQMLNTRRYAEITFPNKEIRVEGYGVLVGTGIPVDRYRIQNCEVSVFWS